MPADQDGPEGRAEARFSFDLQEVRDASEPSEDGARLIWLFLAFVRKREVRYSAYAKECNRGPKTFKRDLDKLRRIGTRYGFALTRQSHGMVRLASLDQMPDQRAQAALAAADTLTALADAFGEIVGSDIAAFIDTAAGTLDPFLRLATPRLVAQSEVAYAYAELRRAWSRGARVRFRYPRASDPNADEERVVEPHLVTYFDGRYYLVGYDRRPRTRDWRQFALDRIIGTIAVAGTFERRRVPPHYRGDDALGLFKSAPSFDVAIELSPEIAEAVTARRWQRGQIVELRPGRWTLIRFEVFDLGEVVRWAFSLGDRARIVAPPAAVDLARAMARRLVDAYETRDDRTLEVDLRLG